MELIELILYFGFVLVLVYSILRIRNKLPNLFLNSMHHTKETSLSLLFAYYTKGHDLLNAASGELDGSFFDVYITSRASQKNEPWSEPGAIIYSLQLSFNTEAHLIGISNKIKGTISELEIFLRTGNIEKVDLEGDFNNYFSLYALKGQGAQARYVFDPAAMAYVVDYCQEFFWEIVGDTLYFVAEKNHESDDLVKLSIEFVKQIEPAIKHQFKNQEFRVNERRRTHKKENIGNPLNCPVCSEGMTAYEHYQECPNGHGRLLQASALSNYRNNKLTIPPALAPTVRNSEKTLICPGCQNEMQVVNYAESGINIDVCANTSCLYRWLDAGELTKIITRH